jgi:hypothetical protein
MTLDTFMAGPDDITPDGRELLKEGKLKAW